MSLSAPPKLITRRITRVRRALARPLSYPPLRRLGRATLILALLGYFGFALLILLLRYAILPQIQNYRPDIEELLSAAIHRTVAIRDIEAHWAGLQPVLTMHGLQIKDDQGRAALGLEIVEVELSWDTLFALQPRFARLEIIGPDLVVRRNSEGKIFIAGLEISDQSTDGGQMSDWLLHQHEISIRDFSVTWIDEQRGAPPLALKQVNFTLENGGGRHRFGFSAQPPQELASRLELRGNFHGHDLNDLNAWSGEAYAELDYADIAIWQKWIDYPIELPQGKGALRLWLGLEREQLSSLTADVRLADVRLRLRKDLAELDLTQVEGRLGGRRVANGFSAELKRLSLTTRDGIVISPTDLKLSVQPAQEKKPALGALTVNGLDLEALARLADHLPLEATTRAKLIQYAPAGRVSDLALNWTGNAASLQQWKVKGKFDKLRCTALGPIPGIEGISGTIDGTERGGTLNLNGQDAAIVLSAIFPKPRLEFENFTAEAQWKASPEARHGLEVELRKFSFSNDDVAGDASGRWRELPDSPGEIDLTARLTRGRGDAVWRYMPLAVGSDARNWLQSSLSGGAINEASLRLKGKLADYPYRGGKNGLFQVKGSFIGANLRYADAWPAIEDIDGDVVFESEKMRINARSGRIFGVTLRDVVAELPDLESFDEVLTIKGKALGPTADFLRFVESSPVGERIDHVTEDMRAEGNGELDLKLVLPLRTIDRSRTDGTFRFQGNQLTVDNDLPPLRELNGQIKFTGNTLEARGLRATLLGNPMTAEIRTAEGNVQVNAAGEISIAALRKTYPSAIFDHLSGATKWTGSVRVKKKTPEVLVSSNLIGLSSSLPPPFNKSATDSVPLSFERKTPTSTPDPRPAATPRGKLPTPSSIPTAAIPAIASDMLDLSLGKVARLQLVRRQDTNPPTITRGFLTIGDSATVATVAPVAGAGKLPERGMQVNLKLPRIDFDFWRPLFNGGSNGPSSADQTTANTLPLPLLFDIHADQLQIYGKQFNELRITGSRVDTLTKLALKSTEVSGNFDWDSRGNGKLSGKIPQFILPETVIGAKRAESTVDDALKEMPALDINIGRVTYKERELGSISLTAENVNAEWRGKFDIHNEDATLKGNALWRPKASSAATGAAAETVLNFDVNAKNLEKLLDRFGYSESLRRGTAQINGQLNWLGSPTAFEYSSLGGNFKVDMQSGQFRQLEPGVGRLLGILSLQSLPRRITLDFRDIFSQGFAFDRINGDVTVDHGVMTTSNMEIRGPAAKVMLDGSVNLNSETQNLRVKVQPALGESLAVGAMIFNPLAGAAVWVAQKLLRDPVDQVLSYEYAVSGSWVDPKVAPINKESRTPPKTPATP